MIIVLDASVSDGVGVGGCTCEVQMSVYTLVQYVITIPLASFRGGYVVCVHGLILLGPYYKQSNKCNTYTAWVFLHQVHAILWLRSC